MNSESSCFIHFRPPIDCYEIPELFTNPFDYKPSPLCLLAVKELQEFLNNRTDWEHNFGLKKNQNGIEIGKMFGVMVVQNSLGELGYLAAFSGKLSGKNNTSMFVPSIFDATDDTGFLSIGMRELDEISAKIATLNSTPEMLKKQGEVKEEKEKLKAEIEKLKAKNRTKKAERDIKIQKAKDSLTPKVFNSFLKAMKKEQSKDEFNLREIIDQGEKRIAIITDKPSQHSTEIKHLKTIRKKKSIHLQEKLFSKYNFLNINGVSKNLKEIFKDSIPGSGAGECAAPKLLQYSFQNKLKPISMAEFWWGKTTKSQNMKHGNFYPACEEKCRPILGHMLEGIELLH